jgi:hypothetical protein
MAAQPITSNQQALRIFPSILPQTPLAAAEFRLFHLSVENPVEIYPDFTPEALKY